MKFSRICVAAWMGLLATSLPAGHGAAQKEKSQISERTVLLLMDYAWALTPEEYTTESNKIIRTNKDKFDEVKLPLDDAREVIRVARLSGQAQMCGMEQAQAANYEALMARETARAKWTDQQMVFINKLHLFTVMTMTGQVKGVDPNAPKTIPKEMPESKKVDCTEADRKRIDDEIVAYVKATGATGSVRSGPAEKKK